MNVLKKVILGASTLVVLGLGAAYSCWFHSHYAAYSMLLFCAGYMFCVVVRAIDDLSLATSEDEK